MIHVTRNVPTLYCLRFRLCWVPCLVSNWSLQFSWRVLPWSCSDSLQDVGIKCHDQSPGLGLICSHFRCACMFGLVVACTLQRPASESVLTALSCLRFTVKTLCHCGFDQNADYSNTNSCCDNVLSKPLFASLCPGSECQKDLCILVNNSSSHSNAR